MTERTNLSGTDLLPMHEVREIDAALGADAISSPEPSPDDKAMAFFMEAARIQAEVHTASSRYQEGFTAGYRKAQEDLGVEPGDAGRAAVTRPDAGGAA